MKLKQKKTSKVESWKHIFDSYNLYIKQKLKEILKIIQHNKFKTIKYFFNSYQLRKYIIDFFINSEK